MTKKPVWPFPTALTQKMLANLPYKPKTKQPPKPAVPQGEPALF